MARHRMKDSVVLLHGIRTDAKWQKGLADALVARNLAHHIYDFGYFHLWQFARPSTRRRQVEDFYDWYVGVREKWVPDARRRSGFRPGVVAHSFGTYIVGTALKTFPDMRFGKVVLCGSILPRDFDWVSVFARNQVMQVRNDYGVKDIWARAARWLVGDAGDSGAAGFAITSPLVHDCRFDYFRHSDYFRSGHYEKWIEFFEEPHLRLRTIRSSELPNVKAWQEIAVQTRAIDQLVYGHLDHYPEVALPEGLSTRWLGINPDIYTVLVDQADRVHGYLSAMPLIADAFDGLLNGTLTEEKIAPAHIVTYANDCDIDLFLMSIAIHPESRRIGEGVEHSGLHRLVFGLTHRLSVLARERGIFVKRLGAIAWTDEGRRLSELLGMVEHGSDRFGHQAYVLDMSKDSSGSKPHRLLHELRALYSELKNGKRS